MNIRVRVGQEGRERIAYEVTDDGVGIEPDTLLKLRQDLKQSQGGFGLKNVDIRVKIQYGEAYGVNVESILGKGTKVRVNIPVRK